MKPLLLLLLLSPLQDRVEGIIDRLGGEDPAVRARAYTELAGLGAEGVAAALRALEGTGEGDGAGVERLVAQLRSKHWRERDRAMRALARMGTAARPFLEKHAGSPEPEVAWRVKIALARIEEGAEAESKGRDQRVAALCEFLGDSGDGRAVEVLLRVLGTGEGEVTEARLRAAEGLALLRAKMDDATALKVAGRVLALVEGSRLAQVRSRLIRTLGGLRVRVAVHPLVRLLEDRSEPDAHLKRTCIAALAATGDPDGLRAVVKALESEEVYVREAASVFLSELVKEPFGFDPRANAKANAEAVSKYRAWWAKKFGREWAR